MRWGAIIVAAGVGRRFGRPKQLIPLGARPIAGWSLHCFATMPEIGEIVVVAEADAQEAFAALIAEQGAGRPISLTVGGTTRQESVRAGLQALSDTTEAVLVHDGARPLLRSDDARRCMAAVAPGRAALLATPAVDTIKLVDSQGRVDRTLDRSQIWAAQTPQAAMVADLRQAHEAAQHDHVHGTDEAALLERIGVEVVVVPGSGENLKITTPEDLARAEAILAQRQREAGHTPLRVGHGFDAHRLVEGRRFVLGGVEIAFSRGPLGHSDGDALTHAIADAILGAAAIGDLGAFFPAHDPAYRDADSLHLLTECGQRIGEAGYRVANIDATVVLEAPRLAPYVLRMRERVATTLAIPLHAVSIKAKSSEGMGYTGDGSGIAAYAVAVLTELPQ